MCEKKFNNRIKSYRNLAKVTQKEVAEAILISERDYGRYERGDRLPRVDVAIALADYFKVPVTALFEFDSAK